MNNKVTSESTNFCKKYDTMPSLDIIPSPDTHNIPNQDNFRGRSKTSPAPKLAFDRLSSPETRGDLLSPRCDLKFPVTTISPRATTPRKVEIERKGWAWIKSGKKSLWKKRWMTTQKDGLISYKYESLANNVKKGIINLLPSSRVLYVAGKEHHTYQISIQTNGQIWEVSYGNDKEAVEDWFKTIEAIIMMSQVESETYPIMDYPSSCQESIVTPKKPKHTSLDIHSDFHLDDYEQIMMELKCHMEKTNTKVEKGYLYITENFLCYASKKISQNKLIFGFSEISISSSIDNQFEFITKDNTKCVFSSLKHVGNLKVTKRDPLTLVLYLWHHAPTYFSNEDIQITINNYKEEKKKQLLEERKAKEKTEIVPQLVQSNEIGLVHWNEDRRKRLILNFALECSQASQKETPLDSSGYMHKDIRLSNYNIKESQNILLDSLEERNITNENQLSESLDQVMLCTQWNMEIDVLVVLNNGYFPAVLKLNENYFQFSNESLLLNMLPKPPRCTKKENCFNVFYYYGVILSVTIEECGQMLVSFNGGECQIRICSASLQLILNQFYLRCATRNYFEVIWTTGTRKFPYDDPTITKLFLLMKTNLQN